MIERLLKQKIASVLGHGKAVVILGARQVGKSTLLKMLYEDTQNVLWLNGDEQDVRSLFDNISSTRLRAIVGDSEVIVIDEAQRINDVGLKLKLITDNMPNVQLIATGSSSFELSSSISESLTGRKREIKMFPLTFAEMVSHTNLLEEKRMIPHRMLYGYYPELVANAGDERAVLRELTDSYLYKDVLSLDGIKNSSKLVALLKALAMQIGSQVSYNEIAGLIGLSSKTIERYIDILEKSFVVFRLGSFSRNLRNELKSSRKVYFWDLGVRNAVIGNFSALESRADVGAMWENFVLSERMKKLCYEESFANCHFWRTQQQAEIDLIEEVDGMLYAYEFKWNPKKATAKIPTAFDKAYPNTSFKVVTPDNVEDILL